MYGFAAFGTALLSLTALTTTIPTDTKTTPTLSFLTPGRPFHLRIRQPRPTDNHPFAQSKYDGLYLSADHTGAGTNDIILTRNYTLVPPVSLNGTRLHFALGGSGPQAAKTDPWSMVLEKSVEYKSFFPAKINVGYGSDLGAFYFTDVSIVPATLPNDPRQAVLHFNTAGIPNDPTFNVNTTANAFNGWLACDWWHTTSAKLFWADINLGDVLPGDCEHVFIGVWEFY